MLLQTWSSLRPPPPHGCHQRSRRNTARSTGNRSFCSINFPNAEFTDILHNKVLIAAAISAAIGQFSKPFTSYIRRRNGLDFRRAFQAGGFPSTHSSAAVAAATTLGFERGFSDSVYGLAVVYACILMYDAQGVRREVGTHAKCLNKVLTEVKSKPPVSHREDNGDFTDSFARNSLNSDISDAIYVEKLVTVQSGNPKASLLVESAASTTDIKRTSEISSVDFSLLKESVGHTEIEVVAGALLGFFVSLAVCVL